MIQWHAGEGEDYPMEGTLETVVFRDFVERGLALPVSEFFYALLQFSGIQLHHLTPQSILHLSIFTHFCEAFLGVLPLFHLFQHFFILVSIPNTSKPAVVGGYELVLHPETGDEYLSYDPDGKGFEWKSFWFHVENFESPLPERSPSAPQVRACWSSTGLGGGQVTCLLNTIAKLKEEGITGDHVVFSFVSHRTLQHTIYSATESFCRRSLKIRRNSVSATVSNFVVD